jgi:hypothetical protein
MMRLAEEVSGEIAGVQDATISERRMQEGSN